MRETQGSVEEMAVCGRNGLWLKPGCQATWTWWGVGRGNKGRATYWAMLNAWMTGVYMPGKRCSVTDIRKGV